MMIFYQNTRLETTKRIFHCMFLFAMIIMVANGTHLGTEVAWDFKT